MKRTILAVLALAASSDSAYAQTSVNVYGLLDQAVEYTNHAGKSDNSLVRLKSGGMNTSRIGFRGTEDLGGGLKAVFQLESGIRIDTGEQDSTSALWNRQAHVGLAGAFGRVVLGRSFSPTYDAVLPFAPMGYAPLYSWATAGSATAPPVGGAVRSDGMLTGVSNMIKYSGTFGAFKLGAGYALGEQAGSTAPNAKYDLTLGYASGHLALVATYDRQHGASTAAGTYDKKNTAHLGASYDLGKLKFYAAYRNFKKSLAAAAPDLRSNMLWGGVSYELTPAMTLTGAVYHQDIKDVASGAEANPTLYVARARYALSKRTDLYGPSPLQKQKMV